MSNRIIKPFLQYSRLNREKFVKPKKNYIESILKNRQQNYSKIISRKICMSTGGEGRENDPKFPQGNNLIYMILAAFGVHISSNINKANKKE